MSNAIVRARYQEISRHINAKRSFIQKVASKYISPERIINLTYQAMTRNPELLECEPVSVVRAVATAAQLGLEPDGLLGRAYLVPIPVMDKRTGKRRLMCQLWVGYLGLLDLVRRSGEVVDVQAQVVREGDEFEFSYGTGENNFLRHRPATDPDRSTRPVTHVWAMAILKGGAQRFEVMDRAEIDRIRSRSAAARGRSSPWDTDYEMMARKTVLRRLCKTLPLASDALQQVQTEEAVDAGEEVASDVLVVDEQQSAGGRTEAVREIVVNAANGHAQETQEPSEGQEGDPDARAGDLFDADRTEQGGQTEGGGKAPEGRVHRRRNS